MWGRDRDRERNHLSLQVPKSNIDSSQGTEQGKAGPLKPTRCVKLSPSWAKCEYLTGRISESENLMKAM